jgi:serine/threonine protein kinase
MELCDMSLQGYLHPPSPISHTGLGIPPYIKDLQSSSIAVHIWNIMSQIANGLNFIHENSEVHRDLKPSNGSFPFLFRSHKVLYSRKASVWKLADFGLTSEATANQFHSTTSGRGTPGYRAPELGIDYKFNNKVDIWSMGCLLHELATGKQAFFSDVAVAAYYLQNVPFPVSLDDVFNATEKECISDAIFRMLEKDPLKRPSAAVLYDEFCSHCLFGTVIEPLPNVQQSESEDTETQRHTPTIDKG